MASKELVAASSRPLILAILTNSESYGYEILSIVRELSGGKIEWSDGMLYPILRRLEKEGLVKSRWGESEQGRRRRYYRLTRAGTTAAQLEQEQWNTADNTLRRAWILAGGKN